MTRIILFGSTYLTQCVERELGDLVIGHVPSVNPLFPGVMRSPGLVGGLLAHDGSPPPLALSVQYDRKLLVSPFEGRGHELYNLHTGLLPFWGGCDILKHTLREMPPEQGLTFHRMTETLDRGPIISKITYPVLPGDTVLDLYKRIATIIGPFARASLALLPLAGTPPLPPSPRMFKRGDYGPDVYDDTGRELRAWIRSQQ